MHASLTNENNMLCILTIFSNQFDFIRIDFIRKNFYLFKIFILKLFKIYLRM